MNWRAGNFALFVDHEGGPNHTGVRLGVGALCLDRQVAPKFRHVAGGFHVVLRDGGVWKLDFALSLINPGDR